MTKLSAVKVGLSAVNIARLKTIQTLCRLERSADIMMTLAPRQQKKNFEVYFHLRYFADVMKFDMFIYFRIHFLN